jgi:hypothetical protein
MKFSRVIRLSALLFGAFSLIQAAPITGQLWAVSNSVAQDATLSNVPASAPLNFNSPGSVNAFLTSGGAFNISGSTADLNRAISPALIEFTGLVTVTNGQQFTATHDDGLTLNIGGATVINVPGPTAPTQTRVTYTGPSGTLPFTLVYGECCGGSAVLQIDLPFQPSPTVPEPATYAMMAGGLALVGLTRRFTRRGK